MLQLVLFLVSSYSILANPIEKVDPECDYNITQLIENQGYICEEHNVITHDGYILGVFRIPHGRNSSKQSLAFILADIGYDVWLGNMRGNRYSRAHVKYNPNHDEAFWDEMVSIDLPSIPRHLDRVCKIRKSQPSCSE